MLFKDGMASDVPVDRYEWHDSFVDCTLDLTEVLIRGGEPQLSGDTGRRCSYFQSPRISLRGRWEKKPDVIEGEVVEREEGFLAQETRDE
jgi:hypothetical protein